MTGPRSATASVSVTVDGNAGYVLAIVLIKGATCDAIAVDFQFNIGIASASVTPASAPNLIFAVALGRASFFGAHGWTNVTEDGVALTPAAGSRSGSLAFVQMLRQRFILFCSIMIPAMLQTMNVQSLFRPSPRNEVKYVT